MSRSIEKYTNEEIPYDDYSEEIEHAGIMVVSFRKIMDKPISIKMTGKGTQILGSSNLVKIPDDIASKLDWNVGSELWIDISDVKLSQAIIGKKLSGEKAENALEELREIACKP